MTGGWRGSSRDRLASITVIPALEEAMKNKGIRWAASVYERGVHELRETAEHILKGQLEESTILRWPAGSQERIEQLGILEQYTGKEGQEGDRRRGSIHRRKKD